MLRVTLTWACAEKAAGVRAAAGDRNAVGTAVADGTAVAAGNAVGIAAPDGDAVAVAVVDGEGVGVCAWTATPPASSAMHTAKVNRSDTGTKRSFAPVTGLDLVGEATN